MPSSNIAVKPQEDRDKVNFDLVASGVAYKERLNMPVNAEVVMRELPEHLRNYFFGEVEVLPGSVNNFTEAIGSSLC